MPISHSTPEQLRFSPVAGFTLRADFNGGGLSSDLGPLLLRDHMIEAIAADRVLPELQRAFHEARLRNSAQVHLHLYQIIACKRPCRLAGMAAIRRNRSSL